MSCNAQNIKSCYLVGTDYDSKTVTFTGFAGTVDGFEYVIKSGFGATVKTLTQDNGLTVVGDSVVIEGDALEDLKQGKYTASFFFELDGHRDILFSEEITITNKPNNCGCGSDSALEFTYTHEDVSVPVSINQGIVQIEQYLDFDSLTDEQKAELKGEKGDKGELTVIHFEINEDMELIQYTTEDSELVFELEEGDLILNF